MKHTQDFFSSDFIHRLITEFGYSRMLAPRIAEKLASMDPEIRKQFWIWWTTGDEANTFSINGYSVQQLRRDFGLNPIAAFSTLDWMSREPEIALATLKRNDMVL